MQIAPQAAAALTHAAGLIKTTSLAMRTALNGNGTLGSRPMAPLAMDGAGALWFFTKPGFPTCRSRPTWRC